MLSIMDGVAAAAKTADVINTLRGKGSTGNDTSATERALKVSEKRMDVLASTKGSLTELMSAFTVEPLIIISENAAHVEVTDKVAELSTDIFSAFYLQAFEIINKMYGVDGATTLSLLGTDGGVKEMLKSGSSAIMKSFRTESALDVTHLDKLLGGGELTVEASYEAKHTIDDSKVSEKYNKIGDTLGSAILQRNLEVTLNMNFVNDDGKSYKHTIKMPLTVRARVIKVKLSSILTHIKPSNKNNSFGMKWIEYRAGLKSFGDLFFSNKLVKEYKEERIKDKDEFLKIMLERKSSSTAKLATHGASGFERSYNSYIITEEDRLVINQELGGDMYRERFKDNLMSALDGLSVTILDEDNERLVTLTSISRGIADTSFKSVSKGKDKGTDLTELLKALFNNRPMY